MIATDEHHERRRHGHRRPAFRPIVEKLIPLNDIAVRRSPGDLVYAVAGDEVMRV